MFLYVDLTYIIIIIIIIIISISIIIINYYLVTNVLTVSVIIIHPTTYILLHTNYIIFDLSFDLLYCKLLLYK